MTYSTIKFDALINSNMSFKCPVCLRTFSRRTAYTQHTQKCLNNMEVEIEVDEKDDSSEMDTRSNQSSEHENDKIEVIFLLRL